MKINGGQQTGIVDAQALLATVFVLVVLTGCFWFIRQRNQTDSVPIGHKAVVKTPVSTNQEADPLPEQYHDSDGHFTISYTAGWQINTVKTGTNSDLINTTTLVSPSGNTTLYLKYQRDYIYTDCIPDYYDQPFLTTNRCFSAEFLKADALPITAYQQNNGNIDQTQWYITHYHFKTITINAKELYASCLMVGQPAVNKPQMGFFLDHPVSHILSQDGSDQGYLSGCVEAGSQLSDYTKPEVQIGESILRSLRFDN